MTVPFLKNQYCLNSITYSNALKQLPYCSGRAQELNSEELRRPGWGVPPP
jgi:hypothetical protein